MLNTGLNPDISLALAYARGDLRRPFTTLFTLDAHLGGIVAGAREPQLARIKLAWWGEQLAALGHSAHPADPLLIACKDLVCLYGVTPVSLSAMTRAWDALIDDFPLSPSALEAFAVGRGQMFGAAVAIASCELTPLIASAGATYALTDFAFHCSNRITAQSALALAEKQMSTQQRLYWPKPMRPFRILSAFAAFDRKAGLDGPRAIGTPRRLWHLARTLI